MNGLHFGQYIPGESPAHTMDPRSKIAQAVILMIAVLAAGDPRRMMVIGLYVILLLGISRVPFKLYLQGIKPLIILILITVGFQIFLVPGQPLWSWHFLHITREGCVYGVIMTYRLFAVFFVAQWLTFTTSPLQLTDGIEKLLHPFARFGLPAHELAMIMSIALRFIPVLYEEAEKISRAQMSRGAAFTGGPTRAARNLIAILVPLFARAFRRAEDLAMAMEARCYSGGAGRTRLHELQFRSSDFWYLASCTAVCVFVMIGG